MNHAAADTTTGNARPRGDDNRRWTPGGPNAGAPGSTHAPRTGARAAAAACPSGAGTPAALRRQLERGRVRCDVIAPRVITTPAQIAHRFLRRRGRPHHGHKTRPLHFRPSACGSSFRRNRSTVRTP